MISIWISRCPWHVVKLRDFVRMLWKNSSTPSLTLSDISQESSQKSSKAYYYRYQIKTLLMDDFVTLDPRTTDWETLIYPTSRKPEYSTLICNSSPRMPFRNLFKICRTYQMAFTNVTHVRHVSIGGKLKFLRLPVASNSLSLSLLYKNIEAPNSSERRKNWKRSPSSQEAALHLWQSHQKIEIPENTVWKCCHPHVSTQIAAGGDWLRQSSNHLPERSERKTLSFVYNSSPFEPFGRVLKLMRRFDSRWKNYTI